jgi:hypothetical protein
LVLDVVVLLLLLLLVAGIGGSRFAATETR